VLSLEKCCELSPCLASPIHTLQAAKPAAEGIARADVPALVAALESAGELQMGFANCA
jgi:hypothetical protein